MGTTPVYHWPYPESTEKPSGHTQIRALAEAAETTVADIGAGPAAFSAYTVANQLLTNAAVKYPLTTARIQRGVRLVNGAATIDKAGLYHVVGIGRFLTKEASTVIAQATVMLDPQPFPETPSVGEARGCGASIGFTATVDEIVQFAAGATVAINVVAYGYGAAANTVWGKLIMYRLSA